MAKFAGKDIELGGQVYTVPAIALGKMKVLQSRLADIKTLPNGMLAPESIDTVLDVALAALNRNYPEMTKEELEGLLDLGNVRQVMDVVYGQSGIEPAGKEKLEGTQSP